MLDNPNTQDNVMGRQFAAGTPVYDVNGDKIGSLSEQGVQGDNLVVEKGLIFPHDYSVPMRTIARSDADGIYLTVTKDDVTNQRFDTPATGNTLAGTRYGDTASNYETSSRGARDSGVSDQSIASGGYADRRTDSAADQHPTPVRESDLRVPVREEQLNVGKQQTEAGRARVHKDVVEEQQSASVPVSHEEVRVEHVPVDRAGDIGPDAFSERDIDVPLRGEQVVANKEARIGEEVHLHKQTVTENQRVGDTVRKERVRIEGDGVDQAPSDLPVNRDDVASDRDIDNTQPRRGI